MPTALMPKTKFPISPPNIDPIIAVKIVPRIPPRTSPRSMKWAIIPTTIPKTIQVIKLAVIAAKMMPALILNRSEMPVIFVMMTCYCFGLNIQSDVGKNLSRDICLLSYPILTGFLGEGIMIQDMLGALLILLIILWFLGYVTIPGLLIPNIILFTFNGIPITLLNLLILAVVLWVITLLPAPLQIVAGLLLLLWALSVLGIFSGFFAFTGLPSLLVLVIILGLLLILFAGIA